MLAQNRCVSLADARTASTGGRECPTPSRRCSPRVAPSRHPKGSRRTRSSPAPRSTTRPSATGRASGPGRRPRARLVRGMAHHPRMGPAVRQVVRRRQAQRRPTTASTATCVAGHGDQVAYHWEGEPGDTRTITYARAARDDVSPARQRAARRSASRRATGSRSTWAWSPSSPIAMLACARIGAPHSVVFGGFSAESLRDRINDAEAKVLDHRRRRLAARHGRPAQGDRRRRGRGTARRSSASSCCGAPGKTASPWPTAATCGGTTSSPASRPSARPSRWTPRTCSTCSTPAGPRPSPRASCTPPAATSPRSRTPTSTCSTSSPTPTCTGAPPTSAGSPGTPTSSTGRSRTAPPACCTRARPTSPTRTASGQIVETYRVTILYTAPTAIRTFMKWGDEYPAASRPLVAAAARHRRRADQPRGVGLVLAARSAAAAARSSTRGGRPRPAPS